MLFLKSQGVFFFKAKIKHVSGICKCKLYLLAFYGTLTVNTLNSNIINFIYKIFCEFFFVDL